LDVAFSKVALHQFGPSLRDPKVRANVAHHLLHVYRTDTTQSVGLHILVEQFIRIQFWAVRRSQKIRICAACSASHRFTNRDLCTGWPSAIRNTCLLVFRVSRRRRQRKFTKYPRGEALTENHEGQPTPIGDRRDHVASETLPSPPRQPVFGRVVRRIAPLDGRSVIPSRPTNGFAPGIAVPTLEWPGILPPAISAPWLDFVRRLAVSVFAAPNPTRTNSVSPSTLKCSSDVHPFSRACATTLARNSLAPSASSKRSRFLVNTIASYTASSKFSPTNQRNKML